ncbi:hypothetical protein Hsar01_03211 [Haloferula sargassicola]|uniref:Uncharacterized protein n=1 Tax=Haloferula sargassicola TaxID=490096 RepID=A0ABP9UV95_9BACT
MGMGTTPSIIHTTRAIYLATRTIRGRGLTIDSASTTHMCLIKGESIIAPDGITVTLPQEAMPDPPVNMQVDAKPIKESIPVREVVIRHHAARTDCEPREGQVDTCPSFRGRTWHCIQPNGKG